MRWIRFRLLVLFEDGISGLVGELGVPCSLKIQADRTPASYKGGKEGNCLYSNASELERKKLLRSVPGPYEQQKIGLYHK
jgi:hypothetical protein